MPTWRNLLLSLYYHGSRPYRWQRDRRAAARGRMPVVVLFYHRVADDGLGAWTHSSSEFARQMDWLARRFDLVSLEEAQRRLASGNDRPTACVTFDDGYADNCQTAVPLLLERRIPCAYFVTWHNVVSGEPFAHDLALANPSQRERESAVARPNTIEQLREMAAAGIEIGAHCRHHVDLGGVREPARLFDELVTARDELQEAIGRPIRYLALPFGQYANLTSDALALARSSGYLGFCSAYGGYNRPGDDPFHLQRLHVDDLIRLKNRATIDPRTADVPRFRESPSARLSR